MKYLKLEHYIEEGIDEEVLDTLKLEATDVDDLERQDFWRKKISGSKIKDITSRPLTTIAYLLGLITEEEWTKDIEVIPRMNLYRNRGQIMEDIIINDMNDAIKNEYTENEDGLKLYDLIQDSSSVPRIKETFCPRANEKYLIKSDKRTLFRKGKKHSSLFMLNIDGYTTNDDGSIRQLVEVKTKTGAFGNNLDYAGYIELHFDQITYYSIMLGTSHGAVLLVDHHSRATKVHTFTQREIKNNWLVLAPKIKAVGIAVAGTRASEDKQTIIDTINNIDWGTNESITKEALINSINLMHKEG